jgi:hypothetical protein
MRYVDPRDFLPSHSAPPRPPLSSIVDQALNNPANDLIGGGVGLAARGVKGAGTAAKTAGPTVSKILESCKGTIKNAPLPKGSPSWDSIMHKTMEEIEQLAKQGEIGYKTIKKLLESNRFKKPKKP